jgi:hypothetical protein
MGDEKEKCGGDDETVVVTPEMISAGVRAYYQVDMRAADADYLVEVIYLAMASALRKERNMQR